MSTATITIIILSIIILISGWLNVRTQRELHWHQKSLEWFAEHVYTDPNVLPKDAPKELLDMLGKAEVKHPDNKS